MRIGMPFSDMTETSGILTGYSSVYNPLGPAVGSCIERNEEQAEKQNGKSEPWCISC